MKNKNVFLTVFLIFLISILGCRFYNPVSESPNENVSTTPKNKDLSDKVIDKTVGEERIGVPECDELLDFFGRSNQNKR